MIIEHVIFPPEPTIQSDPTVDTCHKVWQDGDTQEGIVVVSPEIKQAKNALIVRRRALRDELNRVEQAIKSLEGVMGGSSMGAPSQPRKRSGGQVKNTIIQILKASGGMTHADDVVKELEARGVELSAADPKATVVTALIRLAKSGEVERMPKNQFRWKRKELVIMPTEGNEEDPDEE